MIKGIKDVKITAAHKYNISYHNVLHTGSAGRLRNSLYFKGGYCHPAVLLVLLLFKMGLNKL